MAQYLAPGVYVEEVESGAKPVAGVGTSTAGFIGVVAEDVTMPLIPGRSGKKHDGSIEPSDFYKVVRKNTATLVTGWEEFRTAFGDLQEGNSTLAHAVYGFLDNGGSRCWVVRVIEGSTDAETDAALIAALDQLQPIDEIALVAVPGAVSDAVQKAVLAHCENTFTQDRFAILDGRRTRALTKAAIQGGTDDSSYGAIYFPWIEVFDPVTGRNLVVPPSGHIAGIYARVDSTRGVHKAPANEVIRGALDVELRISREQQAGLNPEDINVIRRFDGNITLWGAHTLAGKEDAEWRYINVRRLFLFLRESIDEGTQWVVFEPNEPGLWAKITRNVTAFLTSVWRDGALLGATPQEAFFVKCDADTNPPDVRDRGQVVTEVGVAVVKPAEFVVFRISQFAGPGG
ncbi:tail protein [Streptomyces sp. NRRL F-5755]|uniref:phage tail sheath family protein n=1 Tax=Streptomyces sp. NRRL F-5755 TaxID=1519475 RepID=UPI0006B06B80|nr:phage tail sheath subtilisin-like domain-containing protein [Streptomyces sp. NRRL F-5755]KOU08800.1 tail protein [Streptomyces sp. NRRL F-5755]